MVFFFLALVLACVPQVYAKYDPLTVPNNRFGIHIVDPNDVADASRLVNSSGGDWGYVTLVIQDDDRNKDKWQRVFDTMRALHLIPIVRLATHIDRDAWTKPYADSARDWSLFLHTLNWPIENRYVVIFNEPNHANEWGRDINPEEYAEVFVRHAKALHETSEDFFVLPAGLDVSAASDGKSIDAATYLRRMLAREPNLFDHVDGWASHSYPNPGFSGSPFAIGRGTLRTFLWEREYLKELGVTKKLPVFITETGWIHREGVMNNPGLLTSEQIGNNLLLASTGAWQDPNIVAITPFVLNYQGLPFDHFSWRKLGSTDFYPQYGTFQTISKVKGAPIQREQYTLKRRIIPSSLVAGSTYVLSELLKNNGQGIYSEAEGYSVELLTTPKFLMVKNPLPVMEPGQFGTLTLHLETPNRPGTYDYDLIIRNRSSSVKIESGTVTLVPPPAISINIQSGWKTKSDASNAMVLVYDHLTLIHKVQGVSFVKGKATLSGLRNVVPGNSYRIVVVLPYYLPRQIVMALRSDVTSVRMPRLYPLDFDQDGALSTGDLRALFTLQPHFVLSLFTGI